MPATPPKTHRPVPRCSQASGEVVGCLKCYYYGSGTANSGWSALLGGMIQPSFGWMQEAYRRRFATETAHRRLHQVRVRATTCVNRRGGE